MLDVFFTVDVEIWCGDWRSLSARFADAFRRYVYGPTPAGDFGLPYQLRVLNDHGLSGVFFVEPLFAGRFGLPPLAEIVGLIRDAGHEVQLHLHPEWVDEAVVPLLSTAGGKRWHLRQFSLDDQRRLIAAGRELLTGAGAPPVNTFRAGSFGFNADTLVALAHHGFTFDSSYNASAFGPESGVMPGLLLCEPIQWQGVCEYPLTVFRDGTPALRPVQVGACSFRELEGLLWRALEARRRAFVILSHNFELLNTRRDHADRVVVDRFRRLCRLFDRHRDVFTLRRFHDVRPCHVPNQPALLTSPLWKTGLRMVEQLYRRTEG